MRKYVLATITALVFFTAASACKEKVPSCSAAMDHFYSKNCVILYGTDEVSQAEAISGCEDSKDTAKAMDCKGEYDDILKCLHGVGTNQCTTCNSEFTIYNACIGV